LYQRETLYNVCSNIKKLKVTKNQFDKLQQNKGNQIHLASSICYRLIKIKLFIRMIIRNKAPREKIFNRSKNLKRGN